MPIETRTKAKKPIPVHPPRAEGDPRPPGQSSHAEAFGLDSQVVRQAVAPDLDHVLGDFHPSAGMVGAKETLWAMVHADPTLVPDRMSNEQLALVVGDRRMRGWLRKDGFREWLLNRYEHRSFAGAAYDRWIRLVYERMPTMGDKDLIALGKLLAEVAQKMPERWVKEKILDGDIAKMDESRLMETMLAAARSYGWQVTIPPGAPGADLLGSGTSSGPSDDSAVDGVFDVPGVPAEALHKES